MPTLPLRGDNNLADAAVPISPATDSDVHAAATALRLARGLKESPDTGSDRDAIDADASAQLVERIRAGDAQAFEVLFRQYVTPLGDYATALVRRRAVAEELVHDVLLRVWQRRTQWVVRGPVRAYLVAATRNAVLSWLKHRHTEWTWEEYAVREQRALALDRSASGWGAAEGAWGEEWERAKAWDSALDRAVATLPKRCREIFTLRWQRGMSYREVSQVTGVSVRTVENHLARALRLLRQRLAGWDEG